ncbi:hypothetical protein AXF42_Ash020430 [Apostasia shenzhenica]|uniref:Myb/SANT-like domain-containing protein n=1 Tax=Apostasia shenzhenica TaxID=1088818 RepID=A0A2H9ZYG7_9ASPA|nr:hypothetical protein AXF42_Ash020430 [Apostasia shenzhenica]
MFPIDVKSDASSSSDDHRPFQRQKSSQIAKKSESNDEYKPANWEFKGLRELEKEWLIEAIYEAKLKDQVHSGNPVATEWPNVTARYIELGGRPFSLEKLKSGWRKIKEIWKLFYDLSQLSGWKFNKKEGYAEMEFTNSGKSLCLEKHEKFICAASTDSRFLARKLQSRKGKQTIHDIDSEEMKSDGSNKKRSRGKSTKDSNCSGGQFSKLEIDPEYTSQFTLFNEQKASSHKLHSACLEKVSKIPNLSSAGKTAIMEHVAAHDNLKLTFLHFEDADLHAWIDMVVPKLTSAPSWTNRNESAD